MEKKTASVIGIILGIAIIIVGFGVQGISVDSSSNSVGSSYMKFGADFYTEIYDVTKDVGDAVNNAQKNICNALEKVCDAIGWLIVVIGLFTSAYFSYKMLSCEESHVENIHSDKSIDVVPTYMVQNRETSASSVEPATSQVPEGWTCICGRVNASYVSSCACGASKRIVRNMHVNEATTPAEKPTHSWRCGACGNMRTQSPCEHCQKE